VNVLALRFDAEGGLLQELAEYSGVAGLGPERQVHCAFKVIAEIESATGWGLFKDAGGLVDAFIRKFYTRVPLSLIDYAAVFGILKQHMREFSQLQLAYVQDVKPAQGREAPSILKFSSQVSSAAEAAHLAQATIMQGNFKQLLREQVQDELRGLKRTGEQMEANREDKRGTGGGAAAASADMSAVCVQFLIKGSCERADACRYDHVKRTADTQCPFLAMPAGCKRGEACTFKHPAAAGK
jgi:hypothetical protein